MSKEEIEYFVNEYVDKIMNQKAIDIISASYNEEDDTIECHIKFNPLDQDISSIL